MMSREYMDEIAEELGQEKIQQLSYLPDFQKIIEDRLSYGAYRQGDCDWKFGDLFSDIIEELADVACYAYLLYTRIRYLERFGPPPYFLNPCRVKSIQHLPKEEKEGLIKIFEKYGVCYKAYKDERHFCLNKEGATIEESGRLKGYRYKGQEKS